MTVFAGAAGTPTWRRIDRVYTKGRGMQGQVYAQTKVAVQKQRQKRRLRL
jgi:hypothetical protein